MSRYTGTLPASYFDERYAADPDPWRFETSDYERGKYDATLAALPRATYPAALEVGCSIGVLTKRLAARCGTLVALDAAERALDRARARCAGLDGVGFRRAHVPAEWADGCFDLILLSEVVYYLDRPDVARLAGRVQETLRPGGDVVLVHWTGETHYPLSGDEAADLFIAKISSFAFLVAQSRTEAFRLDVVRAGAAGR